MKTILKKTASAVLLASLTGYAAPVVLENAEMKLTVEP